MIWGIQSHQLPIVLESELSFCFLLTIHHTSCTSDTSKYTLKLRFKYLHSGSSITITTPNNLGRIYIRYFLQIRRDIGVQIKIDIFFKLRKKFLRFLTLHTNLPTGLVSSEAFFLGLQMATLLLPLHVVVLLRICAPDVSRHVFISSL